MSIFKGGIPWMLPFILIQDSIVEGTKALLKGVWKPLRMSPGIIDKVSGWITHEPRILFQNFISAIPVSDQ